MEEKERMLMKLLGGTVCAQGCWLHALRAVRIVGALGYCVHFWMSHHSKVIDKLQGLQGKID